ncbi:MAG: cation:proton antiporter [Alphaproteobacteria bacterium]|nr:cation:proton antiporter [Alphaproteobacteria bacterium]
MDHGATFVSDLAMVAAVAAVTGMLARQLKQPSILGYLLAGLIVGPYLPIPLFADPHRIETLAAFGVVLVMFSVGLEFRVRTLLQILPLSGFTAVLQIATLFWCGLAAGTVAGWGPTASAFLGGAVAISSTMVVSGVFRQQPVDADVRSHVLGVLVVQDVVAILLLAIATAAARGMAVQATSLVLLVLQLVGVMAAMLGLGTLVVPRLVQVAYRQRGSEALSVLAVGVSFAFAQIADSFGYSVALGAFLAGMVVAESGRGEAVEHAIEPLRAVFSAIFFVSVGMTVDPVAAVASLPMSLALSALIVTAQVLSVGLGSVLSGIDLRRAVLSGLALGQIGELSFILATIGLGAGLVPESLLPTLVTVATITAFTTPLLLRHGDAIVGAVDKALPVSVHHVLSLHQAFVQRLRQGTDGPSLRPSVIALTLDWTALVILGIARVAAQPALATWAGGPFVDLGLLLLAIPFVVGLVRSARRALGVVRAITRGAAASRDLGRGIEGLAVLTAVLGIGLPSLAVLRALVHASWPEAVLLVATAAAAVLIGRRLGRFEGAYTSGVASMALRLAQHADPSSVDDDASRAAGDTLLADLGHVTVALDPGGPAVGRTLAELNLRCLSGASVIAIRRGPDGLVLPTGHERLLADDVLALAGSPEAIARARSVLSGAPEPTPTPS